MRRRHRRRCHHDERRAERRRVRFVPEHLGDRDRRAAAHGPHGGCLSAEVVGGEDRPRVGRRREAYDDAPVVPCVPATVHAMSTSSVSLDKAALGGSVEPVTTGSSSAPVTPRNQSANCAARWAAFASRGPGLSWSRPWLSSRVGFRNRSLIALHYQDRQYNVVRICDRTCPGGKLWNCRVGLRSASSSCSVSPCWGPPPVRSRAGMRSRRPLTWGSPTRRSVSR